jgi:hypothetical protein
MRVGKGLFIAPGTEKLAVAINHNHRPVTAIEQIDAIFRVDTDAGDIIGPSAGKFAPVLDYFVDEFAATVL